MVQQIQVLKCFNCHTFNSDIVKKDNTKWTCKLCQEKQSVKKVYFVSDNAKDCRLAVQALNAKRGQEDEQEEEVLENENFEESNEENAMSTMNVSSSKILKIPGQRSRWDKYKLD